MAQIPIGNFGQRIADVPQRVSIPRDQPFTEAQAGINRTLGGIATDMQRQQLEERAKEDREAEQARRAAIHAQTIEAMNRGGDSLADLHDEITNGVRDGTVPKTDAERTFNERAGKLLEGVGTDLPQENRVVLLAELRGTVGKLSNGVRKAVTARDQQDVGSSIDGTLESLQRLYRADPAKATRDAVGMIDTMGPAAGLNPEQIQKKKQTWLENTQFTAGYELVSAGRDNRAQLDAAEKAIASGLPNLDPQKRAVLMDRISTYRLALDQRAEVAAQRAAREEERRLKKAEAEFTVFQTMADKGTVLDPNYIDRAITATAGTPYSAGIKALAQQAKETGGLAAQPLATQQRALDEVSAQIAQRGRSPELDKRKDQIEKVLRGSQQDLDRDGLRAGLERGVITELVPLDQSKGMPGVIQQLQARVPLAQRVSVWAGRQVSPMTDDEAAQFKHQLDALPVKERSGMVAALAQAVGPQVAQGLAAQLDKKDKGLALAFAFSGAQTTAGRYTSELVLRGQQAKADGTSTKGEKQPDVKAAQWSARIAAQLDGLFPAQTLTDQTREAALLIAHGLASESGGRLRDRDLERAVGFAVGGSIVEHNGRNIPLPAGIDQDMLDKRLGSVSADEITKQAPEGLVRAGGVPMPVAEFVKTLPGQQLMYAAPGKFAVIVGGRPVLNGQGRPILIGVQ